MLLKNVVKRLITINGVMLNNVRTKSHQIKPGNNAAVEVPDELCDNAFVKGLIESGDLQVIEAPRAKTVDVETTDTTDDGEYDGMDKPDVKLVAESMGIDVKVSWSKTKIIQEIVKLESE